MLGRPLAVALTGGIGAGKSEALRMFKALGAATLSSDEVVHDLLRSDEEVRARLEDHFGLGVLASGGGIDRAVLGSLVFGQPEGLYFLESVLHPRVIREQRLFRERLAASPDAPPICVIEVPLLYEVRGEGRFDRVVVITASVDLRQKRAGSRLDEREERLISDTEKERRADFAFHNDGSLEELEAFVRDVWQQLLAQVNA
ncbi:MAG TPA: dephospho-CoA kinase [Gaiellaceae bacterium]